MHKEKSQITEIMITKSIIQWMNLNGHAVFMNEISGMPDKRNKSGFRRLRGNRGSSDIIGTLKGGRACYIEVKREKFRNKILPAWKEYKTKRYTMLTRDNHLLEQMDFLQWQGSKGAFAMFAFSLDDVIEELSDSLTIKLNLGEVKP